MNRKCILERLMKVELKRKWYQLSLFDRAVCALAVPFITTWFICTTLYAYAWKIIKEDLCV